MGRLILVHYRSFFRPELELSFTVYVLTGIFRIERIHRHAYSLQKIL